MIKTYYLRFINYMSALKYFVTLILFSSTYVYAIDIKGIDVGDGYFYYKSGSFHLVQVVRIKNKKVKIKFKDTTVEWISAENLYSKKTKEQKIAADKVERNKLSNIIVGTWYREPYDESNIGALLWLSGDYRFTNNGKVHASVTMFLSHVECNGDYEIDDYLKALQITLSCGDLSKKVNEPISMELALYKMESRNKLIMVTLEGSKPRTNSDLTVFARK